MIQTSAKSSWLLAACAVLYAMLSLLILLMGIVLMGSPDRFPLLHTFVHSRNSASQLGLLALAAGVCTIAAAICSVGKNNSWLLALNGLACGALGLIFSLGATRPVAFRTVALSIAAMALSLAMYELATARMLRGHLAEELLLGAAGLVSVGFAVSFLAFGFGWIKLEPGRSAQTFDWLGAYFAFSAICMLGLALVYLRPPAAVHRMVSNALPTG